MTISVLVDHRLRAGAAEHAAEEKGVFIIEVKVAEWRKIAASQQAIMILDVGCVFGMQTAAHTRF